MKNFFPIVLDSLFLFFASFVLLVFSLYYYLPSPYHVVISLTLSAVICLTTARFLTARSNDKHIKNQEKKILKDTLLKLNLMKNERLISLIISALELKDYSLVNNGFLDNKTNTLYLVKYGFENLTKADVVKGFNLNEKGVVFLCQEYDQEIIDFASRFNDKIVLKDGVYLFNLLKEKNLLPKEDFSSLYTEKKRIVIKGKILEKRNAKKFFFFGVMLCFFSLFVPYRTYYLFSGVLMVSFSIYLKLFGKSQT